MKNNFRKEFKNGDVITVEELEKHFPESEGYSHSFECDDQEFISELNCYVDPNIHREESFDSFFLVWKDECVDSIWGMSNTVAWLWKELQLVDHHGNF